MHVAVFDLDGTILNTLPSLVCSINETRVCYGLVPIDQESIREAVGHGAVNLIQRLFANDIASVELLAEIASSYSARLKRRAFYGVAIYQGIVTLLEELHDLGVTIVCLTNKPDEIAQKTIAHYFAPGLFQLVHGQRVNYPIKPDPRLLQGIADELKCEIKDICVVGDSEPDIELATQAGAVSIGVAYGFRSYETLKAKSPTYLAKDVAHLKQLLFEWLKEG